MVLGNSSKFTEGFTSFTADDDLMIANLKQAINYSKESVAIPDPSINITNPATTKPATATMATMAATTTTSSMNSNQRRANNNLPRSISNMGSGMPTQSMSNNTTATATDMAMEDSMPTRFTSNNSETAMTRSTTTQPMMTMAITTAGNPTTTKPLGGSSSNSSMSGFKNVDKFADIKRVMNAGNEDDDDDDESDAVLEEEDDTNEFEETSTPSNKRSTTRRQSDKMEGFRGSMEIESKQMRNLLLAVLLSCIGYLVIYSMGNNLLPINEISPQLNKFKRLIYAGFFFLITYICLEVF
jgi:hypothetical protein